MAKFDMLLTKDLPEPPGGLNVTRFGPVTICDPKGVMLATGDHIIVEGDHKVLWTWLGNREIWVGCGETPMLQQFERLRLQEP